MLEVKMLEYADLSDEEIEDVPDNGAGKTEAGYIKELMAAKQSLF